MMLVQKQETTTAAEAASEEAILDIDSAAISQTGCGLEIVCYKSGTTDGTKTPLRR